jgi:nitroreductase
MTQPSLPAENDVLPPPAHDPALLTMLATRRSSKVAHLSDPGPDRATLEAILQLAVRVPDHGKMAPWRFVVIAGDARAKLGEAAATIARASRPDADNSLEEIERARFQRAPVVLGVVSAPRENPKVPVWEQELSAGALCHSISLAARGYGFACTWLSEWVAYDRDFATALGLAATERLAGLLYLGTPTEPPIERPRPDAAALTRWL